jgi:hypothetical protein
MIYLRKARRTLSYDILKNNEDHQSLQGWKNLIPHQREYIIYHYVAAFMNRPLVRKFNHFKETILIISVPHLFIYQFINVKLLKG